MTPQPDPSLTITSSSTPTSSNKTNNLQQSRSAINKPSTTTTSTNKLLPVNLPQSPHEWSDLDSFCHVYIVPQVLQSSDVNTTNDMICHDLYQYLASKHGTRSNTSNKQHKRHDEQMRRLSLRSLKNDVRKQFRYAKSHNFPPEQILSLSKQYHQLVRQHSKVRHQSLSNAKSSNANRQQRACNTNFWRFSKDLLDDNTFANISPAFSEQTAISYFTSTYSGTDHEYTTPAWLPQPAPPSYPFDDCPISTQEIFFNIRKSRSSSSPSPLDQLPYAIFKRCPSLTCTCPTLPF